MRWNTTGNKYGNHKITRDGVTYDSLKEYNRFCELSLLERAGQITNLRRQVPFELIPTQREPDTVGPRGGIRKGKVIEQSVVYVADFVYEENGKTVVEDVKSEVTKTKDFVIKRKLMLYIHGIKLRTVQ